MHNLLFINYILFKKNLNTESMQYSKTFEQELHFEKQMMGTTILAIKYQGGVIACADSRTSSGGVWVVDRAADKIDYVHNHIVVLRSGQASSSQQAAHKVRFLIDSHHVQQGRLPHVKTAAKMFQKLNYQKQLQCGFILAGWDPYNGPQIYSINLGGTTLQRNFTMGGSGSGFIYGFCDANYKENMSFEEARQFCIRAVSLAMSRDGSSGGIMRLVNITKTGLQRQFIDYKDLPYK